ncbi:MAG: UDP-glucose/GDP-mannose dehydrogenase family protein, partial [Synergistales bacterium]|nr:UDP-glucose/GDP-mannose dehydrogenase family protein [Synergistales bacterium]
MRVCVIGTGYVGLVTGACLADTGNDVWCVDKDEEKINKLNQGVVPIYEPGLEDIVKRNLSGGRLRFTTDIAEGVSRGLFIFIAVGTPPNHDGSADLSAVFDVAEDIGMAIDSYKIIATKSTVPIGTTYKVKEIISSKLQERCAADVEFDIASCPEFLKEGSAVEDFQHPDRIIIGTENGRTAELLKELLAPFTMREDRFFVTSIPTAELIKYAANAMLATRISFMNELARLCDRVGADIEAVRKGIGLDSRIGSSFLYAGPGYGGSCFPKDVKALIDTARQSGVDLSILKAVDEVNETQRDYVFSKIRDYFNGDLKGVRVALWGLSFKPDTDDVRESPAVAIAKRIIEAGGVVQAFDPAATEQARNILGERAIAYFDDCYEALRGADALLLATEWKMFRQPDFDRMKELLSRP